MSTYHDTAVEHERRELYRLMQHAFSHSYAGAGQTGHSHLNLEGFMRQLEKWVDAKVEAKFANHPYSRRSK